MEYWDIYDRDRNRTGRMMKRNDWTMSPEDYHLTVLGAIMTPDGRFLITRRVATKQWAPGAWEISGGGVLSGETSREAVNREIREETGIDVSGCEGGRLFSYRRDNPEEGDNYFVDVYRFQMDIRPEDVRLQEEEADDFRLADAEEIADLGQRGEFLHYDSIRKVFDLPENG